MYEYLLVRDNFTHRNRNFDNLPNVSGMGPVKLFKYRSKLTKLVRFPRSLGIGPVMLLLYNSLKHHKINKNRISVNRIKSFAHIIQISE